MHLLLPRSKNLILVILLIVASACRQQVQVVKGKPAEPITVPSAYDAIQARGDTLIAITLNSPASFFLHNGHTLGYEYELLNNLAEHLNLHLKILLVNDIDSLFANLNNGKADLVAYALSVTNEEREKVNFTQRLYHSGQVLVQLKPTGWQNMKLHQIDNTLTRNVLDISQNPIYVEKGSAYYTRLIQLGDEIGDSLNIAIVEGVKSAFDLIELVAQGKIKYTIADQEIASMYAAYDPDIDYETALSMPQKKAWSVRHNSPKLLADINQWLTHYKRYKAYYFTYDKYFNNPGTYRKIAQSAFSSRTGRLSSFDHIIKQEAQQLNWDWRLLAAQIYQESHFNQDRTSWMGAIGLMQVMPSTADMHGFKNLDHAPTNVRTGVAHLKYIKKSFAELDSINQLKFTLAAYNVGLGHIYDAQRLAIYLGLSPILWDGNVAEALLLKSQKEYYQLPECRNGYCRGSEPYKYVNEILQRYEDYKLLID